MFASASAFKFATLVVPLYFVVNEASYTYFGTIVPPNWFHAVPSHANTAAAPRALATNGLPPPISKNGKPIARTVPSNDRSTAYPVTLVVVLNVPGEYLDPGAGEGFVSGPGAVIEDTVMSAPICSHPIGSCVVTVGCTVKTPADVTDTIFVAFPARTALTKGVVYAIPEPNSDQALFS